MVTENNGRVLSVMLLDTLTNGDAITPFTHDRFAKQAITNIVPTIIA